MNVVAAGERNDGEDGESLSRTRHERTKTSSECKTEQVKPSSCSYI